MYNYYDFDLSYAMCYIPFFTAIWFGTVPHDELIDLFVTTNNYKVSSEHHSKECVSLGISKGGNAL
jgi:hypothetical protein